MNPATATDALFTQTGLDERFRADTTKLFAAVYEQGKADASPVIESVPLTAEEISVLRDCLKK